LVPKRAREHFFKTLFEFLLSAICTLHLPTKFNRALLRASFEFLRKAAAFSCLSLILRDHANALQIFGKNIV
jgi:hypothetical protein